MSPGVARTITARKLRDTRAAHGDDHPATWAAYGRAIAAWGSRERIETIAPPVDSVDIDLVLVASLAGVRATTHPGKRNRRMRRYVRAVDARAAEIGAAA